MTVDVGLLGPIALVVDGSTVTVRSPQRRALLTRLALASPDPVSEDALIDAIWGHRPPAKARHALHVHVSELRRSVGEALEHRPGGYALRVDTLDVADFAAATGAGRWQAALELWRGPALADIQEHTWAVTEAARLEELRAAAEEQLQEADLSLDRLTDVIERGRRLTECHPHRELAHRQLALALHRSGRSAEALDVLRGLRFRLDEIGLLPSPDSDALEQAVLRHEAAPRSGAFPVALDAFFGRADELATISRLLSEGRRLITLRGPGGAGKTRLAVAAAAASAERFPGGATFAGVESETDPAAVPAAIARALDVRVTTGFALGEALAAATAGRPALVVLDNLEHLTDAAPDVARLLQEAPSLTVLATSRVSLRVRGETEVAVGPLDELSGMRLFRDRARALDPAFSAPDDQVAAVCARLEGLPLAIELAAARTRVLGMAELARRLDDRLGELGPGPRDAPGRQRTLRAAVDWSRSLLSPALDRLLIRLSVFEPDAAVDAATHVAEADLAALETLIEASLLERGAAGRLSLPSLVRELAREEVDGATRDRHATWVCEAVAAGRARMRAARTNELIDELLAEAGNVRAALGRLLDAGRVEAAGSLATNYQVLWHLGGLSGEGIGWLDRVLQHEDLAGPVRARCQTAAARLAVERGEVHRAAADAVAAHAYARRSGDPGLLSAALMARAGAAYYGGEYDACRQLLGEALPLLEELGDRSEIAFATFALGAVDLAEGNLEPAERRLREAAAESERLGDDRGVAAAETNLAALYLAVERERDAAELARRAVARYERVGDRSWAVAALGVLAAATLAEDAEEAAQLARRTFRLAAETGQPLWVPGALLTLAEATARAGRHEEAARVLGAVRGVDRELGLGTDEASETRERRLLLELLGRLGNANLDRLLAEGAAWRPEALVMPPAPPRRRTWSSR